MPLEALARGAQVARRAVAQNDGVARPGEDVDLAELDLLRLVEVASAVQDEEVALVETVAVLVVRAVDEHSPIFPAAASGS